MDNEPMLSAEDAKKLDWLMGQTRSHDGLAPVDLQRFWVDQIVADVDPFGADIPQVPLGALMSGECVYAELGIPEDYWRYDHDDAWRVGLNKAYNDKAQAIVGRRLLDERPADPQRQYSAVKGLHDVFEARNVWHGNSWWLEQAARSEDELKALLDRVEQRDVRGFILPAGWDREKKRLMALGVKPPLYRSQRGPVTFATSIFGPENLIFLILDNPDLAGRMRDAILRVMLEIGRVLDEEAGYTPQNAPHGFYFCDDNCALMTPDMYWFFGLPILKAVFDRYSPDAGDLRGQHSDSAMGHLLPLLGSLGMTSVNFGPTIPVGEIRRHCPTAVIDGQLAPFTFSRNQEERIVAEFLRDFAQARAQRGLRFATAGSINNGSRLSGMRLMMSAIQHFGQYP